MQESSTVFDDADCSAVVAAETPRRVEQDSTLDNTLFRTKGSIAAELRALKKTVKLVKL